MSSADARVERLRGSCKNEEPGARGIERVARNPGCLRLWALTMAGVKPATAAKILGGEDNEGQSPFALALGQRFDKHLLDHSAANLFALYREKGILNDTEAKIVDINNFAPGTTAADLAKRQAETRRALLSKLRGEATAPNLIIKPRLVVNLVGIPHPIEPDYLVAGDADPFYEVGELKSYPDRGGKTDEADIRGACRQAAVGVVALRQFLALHTHYPENLASARAHIILKVTGLFLASLNRMDIVGEVDSVLRALADAPANLDELEAMLPAAGTLDNPHVLSAIPHHYRSSCKEHCALFERCRAQARAESQPAVLGDFAKEKLLAAGSVNRAIELMTGTGAPPRTPAETALANELRVANAAFRRGGGNV